MEILQGGTLKLNNAKRIILLKTPRTIQFAVLSKTFVVYKVIHARVMT